MKCNHCKKIIPDREEIRDNTEYFHQECAELVKKNREAGIKRFLGWTIATLLIAIITVLVLNWWINRDE